MGGPADHLDDRYDHRYDEPHVPQAVNDAGWCSHCGTFVGQVGRCPHCGARFAFSTAAYAERGSRPSRLTPQRRLGLMLIGIVAAALVVLALLATHPGWRQELKDRIHQDFPSRPVPPAGKK